MKTKIVRTEVSEHLQRDLGFGNERPTTLDQKSNPNRTKLIMKFRHLVRRYSLDKVITSQREISVC